MIDLVQVFEDYADASGYRFAYGRKDHQNWVLTEDVELLSGESVILLFPITENAVIDNSIVHKWNATTQVWIGKKFDVDNQSGTYASLDETERQKYDRRLKDLRDDLATYIKTIFCSEPDLELTGFRILRAINQFDENLDVVIGEITFIADDS